MRGMTVLPTLIRLAAIAGLILTLDACSVTAPTARADEASDLARNKQRWASAQIHDYEFDYQLGCFCPQEITEQVRILVRADAIVSVVRKRDGLPASNQFNRWPRVDDLFTEVQTRLDQRVARLNVTYDPTYGYPTSIIVDVYLMAADDEAQHTAGNLRVLR